jgi:hypothetical protein
MQRPPHLSSRNVGRGSHVRGSRRFATARCLGAAAPCGPAATRSRLFISAAARSRLFISAATRLWEPGCAATGPHPHHHETRVRLAGLR